MIDYKLVTLYVLNINCLFSQTEGAPSASFTAPVNSMNSDTATSAQGVPNIPLVAQSTNPSSDAVLVAYSQRTSLAGQNSDTERRPHIVSNVTLPPNSSNIVQNVQPLSSQTHNVFIPVSNFAVSNNNTSIVLPVQSAQTPSSNQSTNQPTEVLQDIPNQMETKPAEVRLYCYLCSLSIYFINFIFISNYQVSHGKNSQQHSQLISSISFWEGNR